MYRLNYKMARYYIGMDIGGSHISGAIVDYSTGSIKDKVYDCDVNSNGTINEIITSWISLLKQLLLVVDVDKIFGIGFAMPGPFDYKNGVCQMIGLKKFDSLFGLNIRQIFRKLFQDESKPIHFVNDAVSFALGEHKFGAARNSEKTIAMTFGTGFGSAFLIDGRHVLSGAGVPEGGYLYSVGFDGVIADDCFSTRWFVATYCNKTGKQVKGVKEIYVAACNNESGALETFDIFADNLARFLDGWIKGFDPDMIVLGGNISKCYRLFLDRLKNNCVTRDNTRVAIKLSKRDNEASILGAVIATVQAGKIQQDQTSKRKTAQFLIPVKTRPTQQGKYDIYPGFPIGPGKINQDLGALAKWVMEHRQVVIDGYVGVFWHDLVRTIDSHIAKAGNTAYWFHVESAMKDPGAIDTMLKPFMGEADSIFGKITDRHLSDWFDHTKLQFRPDRTADVNIIIGCGAALVGWTGPVVYVDLPKNELQFRMRAGASLNLGCDKPDDSRVMYKRSFFCDWVVLNEHKCTLLPSIEVVVDGQRLDDYLYMSGAELRHALTLMSRNIFRVRPWFEPGAWGGTWMKQNIEGLNKDVPNLAWSFELMVLENGLLLESDGYCLEVSFDFLMFNNHEQVLGDCARRFKYDFPIRFDFLDTMGGGNLSVQCHPRPKYMRETFGMPFTQDETYYILDCRSGARVYLGFQPTIDATQFHAALINSESTATPLDIDKYVRSFPVKKHDLFLIPNGTIHASGKDTMVLEISSAPYIFTFKMYDWVRLDLDGRPRPINIEHGMKNVDFSRKGTVVDQDLISTATVLVSTTEYQLEQLSTHAEPFYNIYRYTFDREVRVDNNNKCHVCMLVEGSSITVQTRHGIKYDLNYAETFVVPAAALGYHVTNNGHSKALLIVSYVKDDKDILPSS